MVDGRPTSSHPWTNPISTSRICVQRETHSRPVLLVWFSNQLSPQWASCSLGRAGEQRWEFCRDVRTSLDHLTLLYVLHCAVLS